MGLQTTIDTLTAQLTKEHTELTAAFGRISTALGDLRTSQDALGVEVAALKAQLADLTPPVDISALEAAVANVSAASDSVEELIPAEP